MPYFYGEGAGVRAVLVEGAGSVDVFQRPPGGGGGATERPPHRRRVPIVGTAWPEVAVTGRPRSSAAAAGVDYAGCA